jgi:IclR family acetate operon transcriptional repressor
MARTGAPAVRQIAAVEKAVRVLDALADADGDVGTNAIARATEINASTVSRLLATLVSAGLVEHVASTGHYRLGLRLLSLGRAALRDRDLRGLARPHLSELARLSGETATLSVPGERDALTVDFVLSPSSVRSVASIGRPSVGHATSVGKVLLAYAGVVPDGELRAYTPRTITDPVELARHLQAVRGRGWAESLGEREDDLHGIAAPILANDGNDGNDELIGILGLQGPAARFSRRAMREAAPALLERARLLRPA